MVVQFGDHMQPEAEIINSSLMPLFVIRTGPF